MKKCLLKNFHTLFYDIFLIVFSADHNSVLIEDALAALKKLNISPETIVDYMEKQKPKPLPNPVSVLKRIKKIISLFSIPNFPIPSESIDLGIHRNPPSKTVDNEKENQEITILSDPDEPTDLEIQSNGALQILDGDQ